MKSAGVLATMACLAASSVFAAGKSTSGDSILPGSNSKEPISVEADKLVYSEKELKAVYSGNVVAIQGDSKLTCSTLTIFMEKSAPAATPTPPEKTADADAAPAPTAPPQSSKMRHMDCAGPVTMVSKTQAATGDSGAYDKPSNSVTLVGNVTLSDGHNVTKGNKLVYDMTTGQATVLGRVSGQFIPGSADNGPKPKNP